MRWKRRLGPVAIAGELGLPASTVRAVLVRCRINRLLHVDRATGEPVRRYEHLQPGDLLYVDVKKLGNLPDGGGWRYLKRRPTPRRGLSAARGVTTPRMLSDNGSAYRSFLWRDTCAELGITPKRTRPSRPQTKGKLERVHRTLAAGWAFRRLYPTEIARRNALPGWLHEYNHRRLHTAIGKAPPTTRLTNVSGQYS